MNTKNSIEIFREGLVFGFDVGTGSIGWAVRRGQAFLDAGVLICPEETGNLAERRNFRRQRRTLRSKKYRRQWFARELASLLDLTLIQEAGTTLPLPESAWVRNEKGGWVPRPGFDSLRDPVALRVAALAGSPLRPEELFTALTHLFRRRGYTKVPWAASEGQPADENKKSDDKDEGIILQAVQSVREEMAAKGCEHPCQLLAIREKERLFWLRSIMESAKSGRPQKEIFTQLRAAENLRGDPPAEPPRQRKTYWPRELLEKEFRAIATAQKANFPRILEKADDLLYGETREVKGHHVFFKNSEGRNPGVLGLKWPRFDNRAPALDALCPFDEQGRPLHVARKNKEAFLQTQWEQAILNFRVIDRDTGEQVIPDGRALARLREIWESSRRKKKSRAAATPPADDGGAEPPLNVEIRLSLLQKWEKEFADRYKLIEGQQPLTPQTGAGRARFSSPTLLRLRELITDHQKFEPPQPVLRRSCESIRQALDRYLADIKHPLVRHRLSLFSRLLKKLARRHGEPDVVVIEAVRSLALGEKKKRALQKTIEENRKKRERIRTDLSERGAGISRKAILRYRLWEETRSTCPFCGEKITQEQLLNGEADIEHLVPRSVVDCNEFYNLTVGHLRCNREIKGDRTPFAAFGHTDKWPQLRDHAIDAFSGRKREIFLSPNAEDLIERKADLQHTAYIARAVRHATLIELGWTGEDGRDPTAAKGNTPSARFQVTNGQLTNRLRQAWGLNSLLHPLPEGKRWEDLTDAEKAIMEQKNRGDLRHHAIDAMVIACTLPWLAHRTVGAKDPETGEQGWWRVDERTRRSLATNPVFPGEGHMRKVVAGRIAGLIPQPHTSRSLHKAAYKATIYGRKAPDCYVAREVFTALEPKDLQNIWPADFAAYCQAAWALYEEEPADVEAELRRTKQCLPEAFTRRLCFSHFQQWREKVRRGDDGAFSWPEVVKIPIRSVKLISLKDDKAVRPFAPGTPGYVRRTGFREVRIHVSEDGRSLVPVFVPSWKGDPPVADKPYRGDPVAILRLGQVVVTKKPLGTKGPPGPYRIAATTQTNPSLIPAHLAKDKQALLASGYHENGVNVRWAAFLDALGYELPHPASAEPEPAGPVPAGPTPH